MPALLAVPIPHGLDHPRVIFMVDQPYQDSKIGPPKEGTNADNNWFINNIIGLTADMTAQLSNGAFGIRIQNGPTNTLIGTSSDTGNFIAASQFSGVYILNTGSGTQVNGNIYRRQHPEWLIYPRHRRGCCQ